MHLSDMLGGYCFYDETFYAREGLLDSPRDVDHGEVTETVFRNPEAKVLEMNSKSGLYPLYVAYSMYALQLPKDRQENEIPIEETQKLWRETISRRIFVLCKTKMARLITRRTLIGYQDWNVNAVYLTKLKDRMNDMRRLSNKLRNPATWGGKEGEKMKFDAVVGNPPYQEMDGGSKASAMPVYQHFILQAKTLDPRYISMIIPAKWYSCGRGLDSFRKEMINDRRIFKLIDYSNSLSLFPTVDIAGGLCYFLWDSYYNGKCLIKNADIKDKPELKRYLNEYDTLIRSNKAVPIIEKVRQFTEKTLETMVSSRKPFGLETYAKPDDDGEYKLRWSKGLGLVAAKRVTSGLDMIDKWKVMISYLTSEHAGQPDKDGKYRVLSTNEILPPRTVCTETYLIAGSFDNQKTAQNFLGYLKTKFARFLILQIAISQHLTRSSFSIVPVQDFDNLWTDQKLYEKYNLSQAEIDYIEATIKPID